MPATKMPKSRAASSLAMAKRAITRRLTAPTNSDRLERYFAGACLAVLGSTTIVWSFLGARIQRSNADQLVNTFLFQSGETSHTAIFPGAHTFLLKWPLFYLVALTGPTSMMLTLCTVIVSLATVGALAYILHRIERRPLVFGMLMLALASVLLLIPPQPVAGILLPVNMAMITTRNLEYVLYIASLALLIDAPKNLKSWRLWTAIAVLGLLMASDNLYLTLSVGGAALTALTYLLARRWPLARSSSLWLGAGVVAFGVSAGALWLINDLGLAHIGSTPVGSPYGLVHNLKHSLLGVVFGVLGILTNLGANPAFDAVTVKVIPQLLRDRLIGPFGLAFVVNLAMAAVGVYSMFRLFRSSVIKPSRTQLHLDSATTLSVFLMSSSAVAVGAFVVTKHYYAVDARYLAIVLFAAFVSAATFLRTWRVPSSKRLALIVSALLCSIGTGVAFAIHTYEVDALALKTMDDRNSIVAQALKDHPVNALVGNYWRVMPVKSLVRSPIRVVPLEGCTKPRGVLNSTAWQDGYLSRSFAYLLTLDRRSADFPDCRFDQIVAEYGRPSTSVLVAGTLDKSTELLLFYDDGTHKNAPITPSAESPAQAAVRPISPDQLPRSACPDSGPTTINVVAHQDDDLLFLSPDLVHDIKADRCVRTIYVTAGDAGGDKLYWLARERGAEAAYAAMLGLPQDTVWDQRIVRLPAHQFVTVANPPDNAYVSLIFMHLPDGNLNGQGFDTSHGESLEQLESGRVTTLHSVDGQSTYTSDQLVDALARFMATYAPRDVRTHAPRNTGHRVNDHSDHMAVGRYIRRAFARYGDQGGASISYYIGYPIREMPQNVSGDDLYEKMLAFTTYGRFDRAVCRTFEECDRIPTYSSYLRRQYTIAP